MPGDEVIPEPIGSLTYGFVVVRFEPARFLALGWPAPDGTFLSTWALSLEEEAPDRTRLITRARGAPGY